MSKILRHIFRLIERATERGVRSATGIVAKVAIGTALQTLTCVALVAGFGLGLNSCSTQKRAVATTGETTEQQPTAPAWHTCLIQNAEGIVTIDNRTVRAQCTMQTVRDSLVVISVMPMLGIELIRIEATPEHVMGIDKMNRRYAVVTYDEINQYLMPKVTWQDLQDLAAGELPTGEQEAFVGYTSGKHTVMLKIVYPARQTDVPLRLRKSDLSRYQATDIHTLLR